MSKRWVTNASPLILLGKIQRLDLLLGQVDELVVPAGVVREVLERSDGEESISELRRFDSARVEHEIEIPLNVQVWDLGMGESEVLAAAASEHCRAVLDDLEARRCAASLGIPVIGTLGVILRARRLGLIPAARPVVMKLRHAGLYLTDQLIEKALTHLGE